MFEDKSTSFRYIVIVCPKCRQHAQIIETGKNTLRCQHCGTTLQTRRLRILYYSEELADAVAFRTRLQAEVSGKRSETFSLKTSAERYGISKFENEDKENISETARKRISENLPSKKDQKSVFLELLQAADGEMGIEEFKQKAQEKGISPEKFDSILKKILEGGELYSPRPGIIKLL